MYNEIIWLAFALFDLSVTVIIYRYFGKTGLYALVPFNLILCNIQVIKLVTLLGFNTTLGNILYTSVFLGTNMLNEFHGKKAARTAVIIGFVMLLLATVYMQVALVYIPAPDDFIQPHLEAIFDFMPRLAAASLAAYMCSQFFDVWSYNLLRQRTRGRFLWLRNGAATLTSQLLDSLVFCLVAFWGVFERPVLLEILFTTFLFKAIVTCLDTPFIYVARIAHRLRVKKGLEPEDTPRG